MSIEQVTSSCTRTLDQIAAQIASARKILVVTGAGISTDVGIPDFRSEQGLYSLIEEAYSSQTASKAKSIKGRDLFDMSVWNAADTTKVFFKFIASLRRKIAQDVKEPSATHRFIKLLRDQRRLVRTYTQNIDGLEGRTGLQTDLGHGAGSKARFTKRALALPPSLTEHVPGSTLHGGCEAVPLHGDLDMLRCSVCQSLMPWDQGDPQSASLLQGRAPDCPVCTEHDMLRRVSGRRSSRIGILRPNVVLYGEEHPCADAIGPLVTADIATCPDLLLIFGTSLKVHGLQKIVKEFANAVHAQKNTAGKVVFVNRTPPSSARWKGVIDTWVDMNCDEFVARVRAYRADVWDRQVALPFAFGAEKKKRYRSGQKKEVVWADDKENVVKRVASNGEDETGVKHATKAKTLAVSKARPTVKAKTKPKPSTALAKQPPQRSALHDISTASNTLPAPQQRSTNISRPVQTPAPTRKRKLSMGRTGLGFDILEDEVIVVRSSSSPVAAAASARTMTGVHVPWSSPPVELLSSPGSAALSVSVERDVQRDLDSGLMGRASKRRRVGI